MFGAHHPFETCKVCYRVRGTWVQSLSLKQARQEIIAYEANPPKAGWPGLGGTARAGLFSIYTGAKDILANCRDDQLKSG